MSALKVAAIQITSGVDWRENFAKVEHFAQLAAQDGAGLIVLPENVFLFSGKDMRPLAESEDQHLLMDKVSELAKSLNAFLVVGSHPHAFNDSGLLIEENKVKQRCWVFGPQGHLLTHYDKVHLFDVNVDDKAETYRESRFIEAGAWRPTVVDVNGVKVGLSVCYDLRFPELYRELSRQGAELLLVPAAFTYVTGKAHWLTLLAARAIENQCYVLGVNQCGWHNATRQTFGHSALYSPFGESLACLSEQPGYFVFNVEQDEVARVRAKMPCQLHRRIGV